ncbi:MAG: tetraacyldisaccharide 4'-kinase [Proteobacteria bacterium]|nr:MAG: tetraacyldisaccharide 4'-kinase [Pseudomonadota bacterium]PIE18918.1 MAG: tetraacyldisaccharide 4'-kinase [Pseudomonadota bacterium]
MLRTLARAYEGLVTLRRSGYERGLLRRVRLPVPVVSVGALSLGGSGKTPVASYLAAHLLDRGYRVGIVHRGYGATARAVMRVRSHDHGAIVGDEAVFHARRLPAAIVVRGADKERAARVAISEGAEVIVLDDGFQHLRLHRELDVVLADRPPTASPLEIVREGRSALHRADLLWAHGRDGLLPQVACDVASRLSAVSLLRTTGEVCGAAASLAGARVFLLGAIARPRAFIQLVAALGAAIVGRRFRRDHRRLEREDLALARASRPDLILCTEKDLARQSDELEGVYGLGCEVRVERGAERLAMALEGLLAGGRW